MRLFLPVAALVLHPPEARIVIAKPRTNIRVVCLLNMMISLSFYQTLSLRNYVREGEVFNARFGVDQHLMNGPRDLVLVRVVVEVDVVAV